MAEDVAAAEHVLDLTPERLRERLSAWGVAPFRASQILQGVYRHHAASMDQVPGLSKADRELLGRRLRVVTGEVVRHQRATDGTQKLLVDWSGAGAGDVASKKVSGTFSGDEGGAKKVPDTFLRVIGAAGDQTECVIIPADKRRTACISSQVGCPVGCKFCASGLGGLDRNLTAGQIVEQVWRLDRLLKSGGAAGGGPDASAAPQRRLGQAPDASPSAQRRLQGITHVVFMGMGEPLVNFGAVAGALRALTADWGMGLSARRVTVSTVGVPAGIRKLAELDLPVTLALSLHAPNDELRRQIIPWARFVSIEQLLGACRGYFEKTGREVTLEYILLGGFNDRLEQARELAGLARTMRATVNLIRFNEVKGLPYQRPASEDVRRFQQVLRQAGVRATIRASRGRDIAAACGQLRHEAAGEAGEAGGPGAAGAVARASA
jgi:23S rRNA (adenine2503-C2)-methyltransferase